MIAHRQKPEQSARPACFTGREDLVVVDVGNSRCAVAAWREEKLSEGVRLPLAPIEPVLGHIRDAWNALPAKRRGAIVAGSVNPAAFKQLDVGLAGTGGGTPLLVGRDLPLPMNADLPAPERVGTDRLCVAAAAFARLKTACVVADFGTAVTIDLVADNNVFLGGTILPGLRLAARALHEHTAQLPLVEIDAATETLGKDTASAIRNGVFAMLVGALREITERYATQIGRWPPLVLTGGDASAIAPACDFVDHVWNDLALEGLVIAYQKRFAEDA